MQDAAPCALGRRRRTSIPGSRARLCASNNTGVTDERRGLVEVHFGHLLAFLINSGYIPRSCTENALHVRIRALFMWAEANRFQSTGNTKYHTCCLAVEAFRVKWAPCAMRRRVEMTHALRIAPKRLTACCYDYPAVCLLFRRVCPTRGRIPILLAVQVLIAHTRINWVAACRRFHESKVTIIFEN